MRIVNAKVEGSRKEIEEVVGPFITTEEPNEIGETLVDLCVSNNLFMSKTFLSIRTSTRTPGYPQREGLRMRSAISV